jgi:hypothetical protein
MFQSFSNLIHFAGLLNIRPAAMLPMMKSNTAATISSETSVPRLYQLNIRAIKPASRPGSSAKPHGQPHFAPVYRPLPGDLARLAVDHDLIGPWL